MDGRLIIENKRLDAPKSSFSKSPATLEPIGEVALADFRRLPEAVLAAKHAFPGWRDLALDEKKKLFRSAKSILLERSDELARLIALEKGSPVMEATVVEVLGSLEILDYYGRHLDRAVRRKERSPSTALRPQKELVSLSAARPDARHIAVEFSVPHPLSDCVSALSAEHGCAPAVLIHAVHRPAPWRDFRRKRAFAGRPQCR